MKTYVKPQMEAVELKMGQQLLTGSITDIVSGDTGIGDGGGGSGPAMAPGLFGNIEWDLVLGE